MQGIRANSLSTLPMQDHPNTSFNLLAHYCLLNYISYEQIWDAVGGILKGVFKGITEADITAVCLDDRQVGVTSVLGAPKAD